MSPPIDIQAPHPPLSYTTSPAVSLLAITRPEFLAFRPRIQALMAGAVVFRQVPTGHPTADQVLVVRRAASDSYPGTWEIPGGSIDETDSTVVAGAVRELWEETGLRARHVPCAVGMLLQDGRAAEVAAKDDTRLDDDGLTVTFVETGRVWGKSTVMVEVESTEVVTVRPDEHSEWAWVTEEEVHRGQMDGGDGGRRELNLVSEGVKWTLLDAFRMRKEMSS
jgi:8-oxo-dGTP pyrophosphatase MutT (NUDIX family)